MGWKKLFGGLGGQGGMRAEDLACVWPVQAALGETPVWNGAAQRLTFIDGEGGRLHTCDAQGDARVSATLAPPLGFVVRGRRRMWVAQGLSIHPLGADGVLGPAFVTLPGDPARLRLNDAGSDAEGHLWTGTMDRRGDAPLGTLYRVAPDGQWTALASDFTIPNGFRFSPDGRSLYVADSAKRTLFRYERTADGALGTRAAFALFSEADGYPDGMAVDEEGGLWVAHYDGGRITRFLPDGKRAHSVALPVKNVTAAAFGGAHHDTLFITTARRHGAAARSERDAGGLFAWKAPVRGLMLPPFGAE
jgi:sugar lactone lactonase YvrE